MDVGEAVDLSDPGLMFEAVTMDGCLGETNGKKEGHGCALHSVWTCQEPASSLTGIARGIFWEALGESGHT